MYTRILYLVFFFFICVFCSKAQTAKDSILNHYKDQIPQKKFTVYKTNVLPMSWGSIPLTAEYRILIEKAVRPHQSVCYGVSFLGKPWWWKLTEVSQQLTNNNRKVSILGFRLQGAYRFYLNKKLFSDEKNYAPSGFYSGPVVSYSQAKLKFKNPLLKGNYIDAYSFFATWNTGYQAVFNRFAIDFFSGLGYKKNDAISHQRRGGSVSINNPDPIPYYSNNFKISLGFNFGWAF